MLLDKRIDGTGVGARYGRAHLGRASIKISCDYNGRRAAIELLGDSFAASVHGGEQLLHLLEAKFLPNSIL